MYHAQVQSNDFYAAGEEVIKEVNAFARKHQLSGAVKVDHICYKCDSERSFEERRRWFEGESEYFHQAIISKRRIAYLRLRRGIGSNLGMINFVELADQKPDGSQTDVFDHVEIYPVVGTYEELVAKLEQAGESVLKVERPHHTTHDITLPSGFLVRLCREPLIEKIKREEMR